MNRQRLILRFTSRSPGLVFRTGVLLVLATFGILLSFNLLAPDSTETVKAASSSTLTFQARLLNANGSLVADGLYNVEFKIYDSAAAGASAQGACSLASTTDDCWWVETRTGGNRVTVKNGYLYANLGSVTPFGGNIPWDQELWITMNIGGTGAPAWDGEMTPRFKVTAVPYALTAGRLQTTDSGITNQLSFATPSGSNKTITIPNASGTICLTSGNCAGIGGTGDVLQGGNSFGAAMTIGTNDNFNLNLETNGTTRLTIDTAGSSTFNGNLTVNSAFLTVTDVNGDDITIGEFGTGPGTIDFLLSGGDYTQQNLRIFGDDAGDGFVINSFSVIAVASNFSGAVNVSGLGTFNGNLTVQAGDTFTFNGDAFTDLTGDGLQIDTGALEVDATVCRTSGNCAGIGGTGDVLNNGQPGTVRIGSNDANSTILESNGVDRLTIDSTGAALFNGSLSVTNISTDTSSTIYGTNSQLTASPGSASTGNYVGAQGRALSSNAANMASAWLIGVRGETSYNGVGTLGNAAGLQSSGNLGSNSHVSTYSSVSAQAPFFGTGSSVGNYRGVAVELPDVANTSNQVGLLLTANIFSQPAGDWAIYSTSTAASLLSGNLTVNGEAILTTISGAGLTDCDNPTTSKLLWDSTAKVFSCGTDQTGGGVTTMAAIGASPNANGATISGNTLTLQPASVSFGGVVTTGTQSFAGAKTFTGATTISVNGADSTPSLNLSGSWFTGGTSATTKPQLLIQPSAATSNNWSTLGTGLGVNAASQFAGNLLDLQTNGSRALRVGHDGTIYFGNAADCNGGCLYNGGVHGYFGLDLISHNGGSIYLQTDPTGSVFFANMTTDITTFTNEDLRIAPNGSGDVLLGTSDTTATLLVLDTKTNAEGVLAGINGGMYYNSNASKFRCYEGGAWKDCITAGGSGVTTVGTLDGGAANNNGATITGTNIFLQSASDSFPGLVNTTTQSFAGAKTFTSTVTVNSHLTVDTDTLFVDATNNRVGIGTVTPNNPLDILGSVNGDFELNIKNANTGSSGCAGQQAQNSTNGVAEFGICNANYGSLEYQNRAYFASAEGAVGISVIAFDPGSDIRFFTGGLNMRFAISESSSTLTGTGATSIAGGSTLSLTSTTTSALTIDSGTTGTINIATGTGAKIVNVGTGGTGAKTVNVGSTASTGATTIQSGTGNIILQVAGTGTIGRVQIGVGGAGSATPDYLALDVKNSTGDPAGGTEGYMYYNTTDNKFRCFQGSGWTDCITSPGGLFTDSGTFAYLTQNTDSMSFGGTTDLGAKLQVVGTSNQTQLLIRAFSGQTNASPLVLAQTSGGSELFRLHAPDDTSVFLGLSAGATVGTSARSVGIGRGVLQSNTGGNNVGIGWEALYSAGTGFQNVAIGSQALYSNGTGNSNVAIGHNALFNNGDGSENVAIGRSALSTNTSGANNVAIGQDTLLSNTLGSYNIALGEEAQRNNTEGNDNIALGRDALYSNTIGNDNIALGYQSQQLATGNFNISLGASSLLNTTGDGNIAIGPSALRDNTTGSDNIALGSEALSDNSAGNHNIALGVRALQLSEGGSRNIALGSEALRLSTGDDNIAIGFTSLTNSTGNSNIAIGSSALQASTSGWNNTALGSQAGQGGSGSVSDGGTYIGAQAGLAVTSAENNVFLGRRSGVAVTTGDNNVLLGYQAGYNITTGSNNIVIGWDLAANSNTASNQLNIAGLLTSDNYTNGGLTIGTFGSETGAINMGVGFGAQSINIGTGAAAKTVVIGSLTATGSTAIRSGSGGINIQTSGASNVTIGNSDLVGSLLVLDTKTQAGDPAGVNGGMYYNSDPIINRFRIYEGGSWRSIGDIFNGGNDGTSTVSVGTTGAASFQIEVGSSTMMNFNHVSGNIEIGQSNTIARQLILDTKTSAGDPFTGIDGGMYYNSNSGKFRCYQNSAWVDCISPIQTLRVITDFSNNTTGGLNVTGLTWTAAANTDYSFDCTIIASSAAVTTGIQMAVNGPATPAQFTALISIPTTANSAMNASTQTVLDTFQANTDAVTTRVVGDIKGVLRNGANAGTAAIRLRSEIASSAVTVHRGSFCTVW